MRAKSIQFIEYFRIMPMSDCWTEIWFAWRRKEHESINNLNKNIHINKFDVKNIYKLHSFYGEFVRFTMELTPHKTIQKGNFLSYLGIVLCSSVLFLKLDLNFSFFKVFSCSYHFYTQNAYHKRSWCNLFIAIISMNLKFMPFEKPENEANFSDFTLFMWIP